MSLQKVLMVSMISSITPAIMAQQSASPEAPSDSLGAFALDSLQYEQRVHSTSGKFKYRFTNDTNLRLRLDIDPYKYPEENKSSKFEVRLYHRYENFEVQADFDVNGDDNGRGATTFGPDADSKDSFLAYNAGTLAKFIFYPYNFGGEVGREFRTLDVTRLYYIQGTPDVINENPTGDVSITMRTAPGLELQLRPIDSLTVYAGIGSASFEYPASKDFDIKNQPTATVWKIKEDRAYKGGLRYETTSTRFNLEYVTHTQAEFTGSLLDSAGSAQIDQKFGALTLSAERTTTRAGTRAYKLAEDGRWFDTSRGYYPIYVDYDYKEQNWLGQTASANMLQVAYNFGQLTPFLAAKYFEKNFIFRRNESAEKLRTVDGSLSHGGLSSYKLGTEIALGKWIVRPEVEHFVAKNAVFGNRQELREFSINSEGYGKENTVFTLNTSYSH
jgi:hypothetical protein